MIHSRTIIALGTVLLGAFIGGSFLGEAPAVSLLVAFGSVAGALLIAPHAETVAVEWREHERLQDDREVDT